MVKFKIDGDRGAMDRLWRALHYYQNDRASSPLAQPIVSSSWPIDPKLPLGPHGVSTDFPLLLHTMTQAAGVTVEPLSEKQEPLVNEASLFDELKSIAKAICDFAYENKRHTGLFFDVVAKDGGVFRVDLSIIRLDAFPRKPLVVLEPKNKGVHPFPIGAKRETVTYGTRPDGSYRSPGNWTDELEAEYQTFLRERIKVSPFRGAVEQVYADPEQGRENYLSRRDDLIADGWVKA